MQSKGNAPNAAQKRWRERVRGLGCIVGSPGPVEIHHPIGQSGKHNKVAIGHAWILPLGHEAHEILTKSRKEFSDRYMKLSTWNDPDPFKAEKLLFIKVLRLLNARIDEDIAKAIMDYHR